MLTAKQEERLNSFHPVYRKRLHVNVLRLHGVSESCLMDLGILRRTYDDRVLAIKLFFKENGKPPNKRSKDPYEAKLGRALSVMCAAGKEFCPKMKAWRDLVAPVAPSNSKEDNVVAIKLFFKENGRTPSQYSKDPYEKKLGKTLKAMCSPSSDQFCPKMKAWRDLVAPVAPFNSKEDSVKAIKLFFDKNGRTPSRYPKDPYEAKLGRALSVMCAAGKRFCPKMKAWRDSLKKKKLSKS